MLLYGEFQTPSAMGGALQSPRGAFLSPFRKLFTRRQTLVLTCPCWTTPVCQVLPDHSFLPRTRASAHLGLTDEPHSRLARQPEGAGPLDQALRPPPVWLETPGALFSLGTTQVP